MDRMSGSTYTVVDLFSGAGGMSFGFRANPAFRIVAAVDAEIGKPSSSAGTLACNATYSKNIGVDPVQADLSALDPKSLRQQVKFRRGELDVLISCAPCTGFSRVSGANHLRDDPRNSLVGRSGDFVDQFMPRVFLMENARELLMGNFSHHGHALVERLTKLGYSVDAEVHRLSSFGLPQIRDRALLIAVRDGQRCRTMPELWHGYVVVSEATTVRRAIADLPALSAGGQDAEDPMHACPGFSRPETLRRLQAMPHDGGSWRDLLASSATRRLLTPAMLRSAQRGDFGSHPDVYGRLWWDRPCVTIKRECAHVGNGRYSHPEQDRLCSVREMALLSGFPRSFWFCGSLANRYRHIGDAVPPLVSFQLSNLCHWMLSETRPSLADCILPETTLRASDIVKAPTQASLAMVDQSQRTAAVV